MFITLIFASVWATAQIPVTPPGGGGGSGTVTSVGVTGANGIGVSGSPVTGSGVIALSLGAITPTTVAIPTNGVLSIPSFSMTGAPITGGTATTTKPLALIETTGATSNGWSTAGTMLGVNSAAGFAGFLAHFAANGTTVFRLDPSGNGAFTGAATGTNIKSGESVFTSATTALSPLFQLLTINLSAAYTFTLGNGTANGQNICLQFVQPATGGPFTATPPANIKGFFSGSAGLIGTTASLHSMQCFIYSNNSFWAPTSPGIINY